VSGVQAKEIAAAIPSGVVKVGVFVNASLDEITAAISAASLDIVQLHGDEPPEFLAQIRHPVMLALRWADDGHRTVDEYLARCEVLKCSPQMLLIDSHTTGQFGGTGATADWKAIADWQKQRTNSIPLVLAGGLTPQNVAAAITAVRPSAVDTASGVESSPGRKDAALVRAFIAAARQALKSSPS
jgi:phosphoribosylanthranilate isomerase